MNTWFEGKEMIKNIINTCNPIEAEYWTILPVKSSILFIC
jgi:hypothetical protein